MAAPRRKVRKSKHLHGHTWQNRFVCGLECGHTVHANGRYDRTGWIPILVPPKTVGCYKCEKPKKGMNP
jgi:hypothetical protein